MKNNKSWIIILIMGIALAISLGYSIVVSQKTKNAGESTVTTTSIIEMKASTVTIKNTLTGTGNVEYKEKDENIENPETLFQFRIFERPPGMKAFPEKTYTKWFDYDIINNTVEIRHRQAGDVLAINKNGGTQRLKKYFINEKISQEERDKVWLVADGHDIMWVVGHRQSQRYQITESTKKILEIHFCKGENYGRDSKSIS